MISASGLCPSTSVLLVYGMLQIMKSAELQSCFYIDSTFFGAVWSNVCLLQFPLHMLPSEHCRAGVSKLALPCATTVAQCCAGHTRGAGLFQQRPSRSLNSLARDLWHLKGSLETPVWELYFSSLSAKLLWFWLCCVSLVPGVFLGSLKTERRRIAKIRSHAHCASRGVWRPRVLWTRTIWWERFGKC